MICISLETVIHKTQQFSTFLVSIVTTWQSLELEFPSNSNHF